MAYEPANRYGDALALDAAGPLAAYWLAFLRVVTGWWFFHAGVTKLLEDGLSFGYGPVYLREMTGTALGPLPVWLGTELAWLIEPLVPVAETLIGLALVAGVLVRLAAAGGAVFMTFFWVGNGEFAHGLVNGDLMGLLLFVTTALLAAGRYYGLDAVLERTDLVNRHPRLRYLLG